MPSIPTSAFPPVNNLELSEKTPTGSPASVSSLTSTGKVTPSTSKKWVLPPRPKPGRKSPSAVVTAANTSAAATNNASTLTTTAANSPACIPNRSNSISTSISHLRINSPASAPLSPDSLSSPTPTTTATAANSRTTKATAPPSSMTTTTTTTTTNSMNAPSKTNASNTSTKATARMVEIDPEIVHNPIKQNILKINEENYYLKLEVIRLVSNLKSLRDELGSLSNNGEPQDFEKRERKPKKKVKRKAKSVSIPPVSTTVATIQAVAPKNISASPMYTANASSTSFSTPATTIPSTHTTLSPGLLSKPLPIHQQFKQSIPQSKKRSHDETTTNDQNNPSDDINDLIVSLVDLTHTQNSASMSPQQPQQELHSDPAVLDLDDDIDLLSTVSTTPSTMFSLSLSLSTTNDTMTHSLPPPIPTMNYIHEQPTFDLIDLPTDENLADGKLDLKMNYELDDNDLKLPLLNTFDTLNALDYESSFLMETDGDIEKSISRYGEGPSSNSLELLNFGTNEDVELEFSKFVNGERSM